MNRPLVLVDDSCRALHHISFLTEMESQDRSGSYLKGDGVAVDFSFLDGELMGRIAGGASQFRAVLFQSYGPGDGWIAPRIPNVDLAYPGPGDVSSRCSQRERH